MRQFLAFCHVIFSHTFLRRIRLFSMISPTRLLATSEWAPSLDRRPLLSAVCGKCCACMYRRFVSLNVLCCGVPHAAFKVTRQNKVGREVDIVLEWKRLAISNPRGLWVASHQVARTTDLNTSDICSVVGCLLVFQWLWPKHTHNLYCTGLHGLQSDSWNDMGSGRTKLHTAHGLSLQVLHTCGLIMLNHGHNPLAEEPYSNYVSMVKGEALSLIRTDWFERIDSNGLIRTDSYSATVL